MRLRESALRAIAQGVFITDPARDDEPITYVNAAFERLTGYALREVKGRDIEFLRGPETDAAAVEEMRAAYRDGRNVSVEVLFYRKDGSPFWATLSAGARDRRERSGDPLRRCADRRHRAEAHRGAAAGGQGGGRGRQRRQEPVPGQHEPRAAHAAERHHRVQRDAPGRGRGSRPRRLRARPGEDPRSAASICWP